jgi:hypothetical protein
VDAALRAAGHMICTNLHVGEYCIRISMHDAINYRPSSHATPKSMRIYARPSFMFKYLRNCLLIMHNVHLTPLFCDRTTWHFIQSIQPPQLVQRNVKSESPCLRSVGNRSY